MAKTKRTARKSFTRPDIECIASSPGSDRVGERIPAQKTQRKKSKFGRTSNNVSQTSQVAGVSKRSNKSRRTHDVSKAGSSQTSFQQRTVGKAAYVKWKPVQGPSRKYVTTMLDSVIDDVMSVTPPDHLGEVGGTLHKLRKRLMKKLDELKVPSSQVKDYTNVSSEMEMAKRSLVQAQEQEKKLENVIEKEMRKKMRQLGSSDNDGHEIRRTLEPLLLEEDKPLEYPDHDCMEML